MKKITLFIFTVLVATGVFVGVAFGNTTETGPKEPTEAPQRSADSLAIRQITIPSTATIADGFIYYVGEKGVVYQAPLEDTAMLKSVYQLPDGNLYSEDGYAVAWLTTIDGTAVLKYHMGGASMGSDYAVALYPDGSHEDWSYNYSVVAHTDEAVVALASDYRSRALTIRWANEQTAVPLGESSYSYGYYITTDWQGARGFVSSSDLAVINDDVYVLAGTWNASGETSEAVGIYKVNMETNETQRVFPNKSINHFKVGGGYIYFTDFDGLLYKAKIGAEQAMKVSDIAMKEFFVLGDEIYYTPFRSLNESGAAQELFKLGGSEPLVAGSVLELPEMEANTNDGYLACRLYDTYSQKYQGLVIDKSGGAVVLKADDIQYITVADGAIYAVAEGELETLPLTAGAEAQNDIKIVIDGQPVAFSPADGLGMPFIQYDRTMVPLRKLLEALGASVGYDADTRTAVIKKDDTEISVMVDGGMLVNGSRYQVDAPAMIKDGRVYVPIRHVFEVLGYSLFWDQETKTITITQTGPPIETVTGWSVPSPAAGSTGLGMSAEIGVLTGFYSYDKNVSLSDPEQIKQLNTVGIGLRNFSSSKAIRLDAVTFQYQVFKTVNGKEELVYQATFLPFAGTLPALSGTSTEIKIDYWDAATMTPGEYTIKLAYPEFFTGIYTESQEEVKIPVDSNIFAGTVTIKIN
ncbi:MAG TPA: stalk domain-containing protein [Syntrophomonas sp.]|nr:stalk domain-containing protein [Syntrophomonas sp.]